jgi:hypothetical protein
MHQVSAADRAFVEAFRAGRMPAADFGHREHVRLAYVYLAEGNLERAFRRMRGDLRRFLAHHGVDSGKYHETLTRAWMLAVRGRMDRTPAAESAAAFVRQNPELLRKDLLLAHYSAERLYSEDARTAFAQPDRAPLPEDPGSESGSL